MGPDNNNYVTFCHTVYLLWKKKEAPQKCVGFSWTRARRHHCFLKRWWLKDGPEMFSRWHVPLYILLLYSLFRLTLPQYKQTPILWKSFLYALGGIDLWKFDTNFFLGVFLFSFEKKREKKEPENLEGKNAILNVGGSGAAAVFLLFSKSVPLSLQLQPPRQDPGQSGAGPPLLPATRSLYILADSLEPLHPLSFFSSNLVGAKKKKKKKERERKKEE